jgi:hypothetical protein
MIELSGDESAVWDEVRAAQNEGREVSDACARVIASWWHGGQASAGYSFVSTGAITTDDPSELWRELGGRERDGQPEWMKDALDCLGTYLVRRVNDGRTGAVAGWSGLWVR